MDKITLLIVKNLNFNQIMLKLLTPNEADKVFPDQVIYKTILLVALSTGLPLKDLIKLKWNAIFKYNSKGGAVCVENFNLNRNYDFPINEKIKNQLIQFYTSLNQPDFDKQIAESFKSPQTLDRWLLGTNIALGIRRVDKIDKDEWSEYRNEHLTQIIFGRRVVETCGHSNKTGKLLKGLFKIETNEQLFAFLGYDSKSEIKYDLSNLSIIENLNQRYSFGEPRSFLDDDKHFYALIKDSKKHYPFQHFQVFYDFLQNLSLHMYDIKNQGVLVLLMLSLTNGIRPSALLKLKWSDILCIPENKDTYVIKNKVSGLGHKAHKFYNTYDFEIKREFKYGRNLIKVDEKTETKIKLYCRLMLEDKKLNKKRKLERLFFSAETASLKGDCFVTNRLNPLTQNSLHREIQNTLQVTGFQHAEKFTTKSTQIMYGRRIIELKGLHSPTVKALKTHFNIRKTQNLFDFLYISNQKGKNTPAIKEFRTVFEHILYDI
ncbi:hypothetical protein SAMN06265371_101289 [Lutibacter agarilyticus]|uniref:Uncharacterized protein n=1 Tax=Lutibacter agarilyticus TaxID=1109740 RepID=A0A238VGE7_9FLAO|nr:hypothetical protein [Lutibacter agarilyticus]SNR32589.1 hypothetical protein SAMN06265371_101289 [Lutibacter agarilyticus]